MGPREKRDASSVLVWQAFLLTEQLTPSARPMASPAFPFLFYHLSLTQSSDVRSSQTLGPTRKQSKEVALSSCHFCLPSHIYAQGHFRGSQGLEGSVESLWGACTKSSKGVTVGPSLKKCNASSENTLIELSTSTPPTHPRPKADSSSCRLSSAILCLLPKQLPKDGFVFLKHF